MSPSVMLTAPPPATLSPIEDVSRRGLLSTALTTAAFLIACRDERDGASPEAVAATRTIDTPMGQVTVPVEPQRVVALWRPTMAAAVQVGVNPIGTIGEVGAPASWLAPFLPDSYAVEKVELVGSNTGLNVEKIATLRPDLILGALTNSGEERDLYARLRQIAPTALFTWEGTTSWRQHVVDVGEALGARDKVDAIVRDYQHRIAKVRAAAGGATAGTVSLVRVQGPGVMRLETALSFPGQIIADIGFSRPRVQQAPEEKDRDFIQISLERIRDADGDVVFVMFNSSNEEAWEQIEANPLWRGLSGQRGGKVFTAPYEWWGASNYYGAHRIIEDVQRALG